MRFPLVFLCTALASLVALPSIAQQSGCGSQTVRMNLFLPDGRLVNGLKRDSIVVQAKGHKIAVNSLDPEGGTRRVLIILDTGDDLSSDAHKATALALKKMVEDAPAGDSIALNTARGPARQVKFEEGRSKASDALDELSAANKEPKKHNGVLDSLHEGIAWFGHGQPGDSVIIVADGIEQDNHVSFHTVAGELREKGIRVFSVQLGPIMAGEYWTVISSAPGAGGFSVSTATFSNYENISALSWNSGGYMTIHMMEEPWKSYHITTADLQALESQLRYIYDAILGEYVLQVSTDRITKPTEWTVRLTDALEKRVPQARFAYPRLLMPCGK
jgi:hypothetical protein